MEQSTAIYIIAFLTVVGPCLISFSTADPIIVDIDKWDFNEYDQGWKVGVCAQNSSPGHIPLAWSWSGHQLPTNIRPQESTATTKTTTDTTTETTTRTTTKPTTTGTTIKTTTKTTTATTSRPTTTPAWETTVTTTWATTTPPEENGNEKFWWTQLRDGEISKLYFPITTIKAGSYLKFKTSVDEIKGDAITFTPSATIEIGTKRSTSSSSCFLNHVKHIHNFTLPLGTDWISTPEYQFLEEESNVFLVLTAFATVFGDNPENHWLEIAIDDVIMASQESA